MGIVRWGFLTTAHINDALLEGIRLTPFAEVVAVASRDRERAERYASERGIPRAHAGYEELLADPDVDVVYIALPNALHVRWTIRALESGKHVLCEKPFSRDPSEATRAFEVAGSAGRLLMEGFMYRHQPQVKRLRELVLDGSIGELRLVRTQFSFTLERPGDVRLDPELGGGALLDVGSYCVNLSRYVAGEPEVVQAARIVGETGVDVRFAAVMRFGGPVLAHFDCAFDLPRRLEAEVVGSGGVLTLSPAFGEDTGVLELRRGDEAERIDVEPTNRYALQVENFSRAVLGEEPPLLDGRESIAQARALDALIRSAESGRPVRLVEGA